jgi:signal transduction histidine kinase
METSPRVAAIREHASARRSRERRALRLLAVPLLLVIVIPTLSSKPHVSGHGDGLVLALAMAALVAGFVVVRVRGDRLDEGPGAVGPTISALLLMTVAGVVSITVQPTGTGVLALSLIAYVAGARLQLRTGIAVVSLATLAMVVAVALQDQSSAISISSSVLLAALLFALARLNKRAEDDRERAEIASAELADARDRELESAAIAERGRIARELHDVLAHSLSGLSLQLEGARLLAERDGAPEELRDSLARARRLAADGLADAKRAVQTLRGDALPGVDDLPALVGDFGGAGLDVRLRTRGAARPLPSEAGLALYRAAQEALTNVVRHSGASAADVELEYADNAVRLIVTDSGGDTPALTEVGSGYGLSAMRERAELMGGRLRAGPSGAGFRVTVELPL